MEKEHIEALALPLWVFALRYRDDKPPLRVLVNGQTGKVAGAVPPSALKVGFAGLVVLAVVAALFALWNGDI